MRDELSKAQLVELVERIMGGRGNEREIENWLDLLQKNVPHPGVSDLIFWPHKFGLGDSPTAGEIVEKALAYKPIQL
jgi:hypothetical protein